MTLQTRVFNPRGARKDGGGLIAQVVIGADEVEQWLQPSAIARARFARAFDRVTWDLRREVERVLGEEADRLGQQERALAAAEAASREAALDVVVGHEGAASTSLAVDAHDDVPADGGGVRQPPDSQPKEADASGVSTLPSTHHP